MTVTTAQKLSVHVFENAGLGKAPFHYIGMNHDPLHIACSCQYCGTSIIYQFVIQSSDGKKFIVGSDCVYKTGDAGLMRTVKAAMKIATKKNKVAKRDLKNITIMQNEGIIPFGKYLGQKLTDIPVSYLAWLSEAMPQYAGILEPLVKPALSAQQIEKDNAEQARYDRDSVSNHVGNVGDKIEIDVTVNFVRQMPQRYYNTPGARFMTMRDSAGNIYQTTYSGSEHFQRAGNYKIKATIKKHGEYNTIKQTTITRIKKVA